MLAVFEPSGAVTRGPYRYLLWRTWNVHLPAVTFVMLNPSTADATLDDPTIRRCTGFAQRWGYGVLLVVNLFAFRAVRPCDLLATSDPVGPENDTYLRYGAEQSSCLMVAWGCLGRTHNRDCAVLELLLGQGFRLFCLGRNRDGSPKHPLYVGREVERQCFP